MDRDATSRDISTKVKVINSFFSGVSKPSSVRFVFMDIIGSSSSIFSVDVAVVDEVSRQSPSLQAVSFKVELQLAYVVDGTFEATPVEVPSMGDVPDVRSDVSVGSLDIVLGCVDGSKADTKSDVSDVDCFVILDGVDASTADVISDVWVDSFLNEDCVVVDPYADVISSVLVLGLLLIGVDDHMADSSVVLDVSLVGADS